MLKTTHFRHILQLVQNGITKIYLFVNFLRFLVSIHVKGLAGSSYGLSVIIDISLKSIFS